MRRSPWILLSTILLPALVSCSGPTRPQSTNQNPTLPTNETPEGAVLRLIGLYETRDAVEYGKLFTGDFKFEFSNSADPDLVQKWALGWSRSDEIVAAQNLFQGGANSHGIYQPAALSIELQLLPTTPSDDNTSGRDPDLYKALLAAVDARIDVPGDITYVVGQAPPQSNRFFLVRGDAAVGLGPDQPADANRWYVWNWRDESPVLKGLVPTQSESSTWGRVKDLYR